MAKEVTPIDQLLAWIDEDLGGRANIEDHIELVNETSCGTETYRSEAVVLRIYTETNCYTLNASYEVTETGGPVGTDRKSYLCCGASSRKARAGEGWTRGNDIHDGPLTRETWTNILRHIVGYELVRVHGKSWGSKRGNYRPVQKERLGQTVGALGAAQA